MGVCFLKHWFSNSSSNFFFPDHPWSQREFTSLKHFCGSVSQTNNPSSETTGWEPLAKTLLRMCSVVMCQYRRKRKEKWDNAQLTPLEYWWCTHIYFLYLTTTDTDISRTVPASVSSLRLWSNLDKALCYTLKRLKSILKNAKSMWLCNLYQGTDNDENNSNLSKVRNYHRWGWEFNG